MQATTMQLAGRTGRRPWRGLRRFFGRRHFLVDRPFQLGLVGHVLLVQLLFLLVVTAGLFAPLLEQIVGQQSDQLSEASIALMFLHERFWLVITGGFGLTVLLVVRLSHKIAGPLVRFKRNLVELGTGAAPAPLQLRRGDYLRAEASLLNQTVSQLRAQGLQAQRSHARLLHNLAQLATAGSDLGITAQQRLQEAIAAAQELRQLLPFGGDAAATPAVAAPAPHPEPAALATAGR